MNVVGASEKIAIVTGAGRGIGKEIALKLAQNGILIIAVDVDGAAAAQTAQDAGGGNGLACSSKAVDMSDIGAVKQMIEEVYTQYGHIDILVNNAGILDNTLIEELEEELWDRVLEVNLKSAFFCSKYAYLKMKEQKSGKIINISSVAGRMGGHSVGCAYAASKAGIIGMTMNFARKCAAYNIQVNAVAPGTIESDMSAKFTPEQMDRLYANIPMRRLGTAEEIAEAVLFLASDRCNFITGTVIDINGGMKMG